MGWWISASRRLWWSPSPADDTRRCCCRALTRTPFPFSAHHHLRYAFYRRHCIACHPLHCRDHAVPCVPQSICRRSTAYLGGLRDGSGGQAGSQRWCHCRSTGKWDYKVRRWYTYLGNPSSHTALNHNRTELGRATWKVTNTKFPHFFFCKFIRYSIFLCVVATYNDSTVPRKSNWRRKRSTEWVYCLTFTAIPLRWMVKIQSFRNMESRLITHDRTTVQSIFKNFWNNIHHRPLRGLRRRSGLARSTTKSTND